MSPPSRPSTSGPSWPLLPPGLPSTRSAREPPFPRGAARGGLWWPCERPPQPRCQGLRAPPGHASAPRAMRRGVAHPLLGCRVPRRARERDTSVRQAEGKGARTAPTRGREGAAAAGRLRMEGRERFLHPSIGGAGPHRASGPGALARRRIQETPPLCVCSRGCPGSSLGGWS